MRQLDGKRYIIGITGASGTVYGLKTVECFLELGATIHFLVTDRGRDVMKYETSYDLAGWVQEKKKSYEGKLILEDNHDMFAGIASGSYICDGMAVIPCSMSTLAEITYGITKNLLTRAADVTLKQKKPLILVPRETPLSSIHLENMLKLSHAGAFILPAMPAFYHRPETLEDMENFMVGKVLDCFGIENILYEHWRSEV